jgi:hypothetical protein
LSTSNEESNCYLDRIRQGLGPLPPAIREQFRRLDVLES